MAEFLHISLIPPQGWREILLDPADRERQIRQALEPMKHVIADWREVYPALRKYLANSYEQSWKAGVRYAITTELDDASPILVMATFMVSVLPSAVPYGTADEDLDAIVESLLTEREGLPEGDELHMSKTSFNKLGPAVQASSVETVHGQQGKPVGRLAMLRTFIPCAGKVILATGITPQVELSDTLFELFTRITATLRVSVETESDESDQ